MQNKNLNKMIKISLLAVIAFLIMLIEIAIPIFPSFLKIDLSDLPALIGSFILGPVAGVTIELMKNLIHGLLIGGTQGIGELANLIVGGTLVFVAGIIYSKNKTMVGSIIGAVSGVIAMTIVAALANYYLILPLYENVLKFPISLVVSIAGQINHNVKDLATLIIYTIIPFNLLKGTIVIAITLPIYKKLASALRWV